MRKCSQMWQISYAEKTGKMAYDPLFDFRNLQAFEIAQWRIIHIFHSQLILIFPSKQVKPGDLKKSVRNLCMCSRVTSSIFLVIHSIRRMCADQKARDVIISRCEWILRQPIFLIETQHRQHKYKWQLCCTLLEQMSKTFPPLLQRLK